MMRIFISLVILNLFQDPFCAPLHLIIGAGIGKIILYLFTMWRQFCIISACSSALIGCATPQRQAVREMAIRVTGEPCGIFLNDSEVGVGDLKQALVSVPRETTILLQGPPNVRYQCIGGLIYTLQYLGFKSIGFVSEAAEQPQTP